MQNFFPILILALFWAGDNSWAGESSWAGERSAQITAAVAANMRYPMEELNAEFKQQTAIEVKTIYGSSGKLAMQIKSGAPFDVFVSADMSNPDSLKRWGFASENPKPYAYGKLVLWTLQDVDPSRGLALLLDASVSRIALADTDSAPYGRQAVKALHRSGLYGKVASKLVFGESVSQVNEYVLTGNVNAGFTAKGRWVEVDSTLYDRIAQGAVLCKHGLENHREASAKFLAFLYSKDARKVLGKYGYVLP